MSETSKTVRAKFSMEELQKLGELLKDKPIALICERDSSDQDFSVTFSALS